MGAQGSRMATKPPDAFLSYTRFDDRRERGKISQFCQELADAVRALTGEPFDIFQDVDCIGLGEHWPGKLDQMLNEARFFIPILTPSYCKSPACRDELEKFLKAEERAGRRDLILPIYYITCPVLEDKELRQADALATAIHQRQRWDWRDLRHYSFRDRRVRLQIEALAQAIAMARQTRADRPAAETSPSEPTAPAVSTGEPTVLRQSTRHAVEAEDTTATHRGDLEYHNPALSGRVIFNYSNNNGRYSIGQDECLFETKWSKASDQAIHLYNDPPSIAGVAEAPELQSYEMLRDPASYDMSSRARTIQEGEHAILKNRHDRYAVLKVIDIKDRTRADSIDELTFEFWILPD